MPFFLNPPFDVRIPKMPFSFCFVLFLVPPCPSHADPLAARRRDRRAPRGYAAGPRSDGAFRFPHRSAPCSVPTPLFEVTCICVGAIQWLSGGGGGKQGKSTKGTTYTPSLSPS